jgi:iron-sulfur cluster repair protein YtfE (RIC family)
MSPYEPLDATITVNDLLLRFPTAVTTMSAHGIDTCCRGHQSLARAAAFVGVDAEQLLAEITGAALPAPRPAPAHRCSCGCNDSTEPAA